jgi:hypothetical protein
MVPEGGWNEGNAESFVSERGSGRPEVERRSRSLVRSPQVEFVPPVGGTYQISVQAFNVPVGPQDFALVITGR